MNMRMPIRKPMNVENMTMMVKFYGEEGRKLSNGFQEWRAQGEILLFFREFDVERDSCLKLICDMRYGICVFIPPIVGLSFPPAEARLAAGGRILVYDL